MRRLPLAGLCTLLLCEFFFGALSSAAEVAENHENEKARHPQAFGKNRISLQLLSGAFTSGLFPKTRYLDYSQFDLRAGVILSDPNHALFILSGNFEAVFELINSGILKGAGSFIVGFKFSLRYNFIQQDSCFVPYVQVGAGVICNDVYKEQNQKTIGQSLEFMPALGVRSHFFLSGNWSFDAEVGYQHISNARLADRNGGNDALGLLIGIT